MTVHLTFQPQFRPRRPLPPLMSRQVANVENLPPVVNERHVEEESSDARNGVPCAQDRVDPALIPLPLFLVTYHDRG